MLKIAIVQGVVSNHLLEDQLHLISAKMVNIKYETARYEITIRFLEPYSFENIATNAKAWKKFMNEQGGPS